MLRCLLHSTHFTAPKCLRQLSCCNNHRHWPKQHVYFSRFWRLDSETSVLAGLLPVPLSPQPEDGAFVLCPPLQTAHSPWDLRVHMAVGCHHPAGHVGSHPSPGPGAVAQGDGSWPKTSPGRCRRRACVDENILHPARSCARWEKREPLLPSTPREMEQDSRNWPCGGFWGGGWRAGREGAPPLPGVLGTCTFFCL